MTMGGRGFALRADLIFMWIATIRALPESRNDGIFYFTLDSQSIRFSVIAIEVIAVGFLYL